MSTTTSPAATERTSSVAKSEQTGDESGAVAADGDETDGLPLDVVYGLLSNQRRRRTLRFLDAQPETDLGELAEHVAAIENDKPVEAVSSDERKRVYICLYQCHLPKLDDAGVIEFEEARKRIRAGENADVLRQYLPTAPDGDGDTEGLAGTVTDVADRVSRRLSIAR